METNENLLKLKKSDKIMMIHLQSKTRENYRKMCE